MSLWPPYQLVALKRWLDTQASISVYRCYELPYRRINILLVQIE